MKELVYHRLLLPAVERNADRVGRDPGDHDEGLADDVARRAEEASRCLGRLPERVVAERPAREFVVLQVPERVGRFAHGGRIRHSGHLSRYN